MFLDRMSFTRNGSLFRFRAGHEVAWLIGFGGVNTLNYGSDQSIGLVVLAGYAAINSFWRCMRAQNGDNWPQLLVVCRRRVNQYTAVPHSHSMVAVIIISSWDGRVGYRMQNMIPSVMDLGECQVVSSCKLADGGRDLEFSLVA